MKQVLKIRMYQPTANFKMTLATKIKQTYPLPPYSTVAGFLYSMMGGYAPIEISIQGESDGVGLDYQTHFFYKGKEAENIAYPYCPVFSKDGYVFPTVKKAKSIVTEEKAVVTQMPIWVQVLCNVRTIVHIRAEEKVIERILRGFARPPHVFFLGRREDLVKIEEMKLVQAEKNEDYIDELKYDAYIPFEILNHSFAVKPNAVPFMLNGRYELRKSFDDGEVRVFQRIPTAFVTKEQSVLFEPGQIMVDSEGDCLFLQKI